MLSSSSPQDVRKTAKHAELRLQVALQRVEACRRSQHHDNVARSNAAAEKTTTHSPIPAADAPPEAPRAITMEWPLAPLTQRAKEKKARDALRQRRRAARQTIAAAAREAPMSAADVMRNTLSQPFGVMAARLLSAATAGAPSLFSEHIAPPHEEAMTATTHNVVSPLLTHLSNPNVSNTAVSAALGSAGATTLIPSPSGSPHTSTKQFASPHADRRHRHSGHHRCHRHDGSLSPSPMRFSAPHGSADANLHPSLRALSTTPLSPRPDNVAADAEWYRAPHEHRDRPYHSLLSLRAGASPPKVSQPHLHRHHHHSGHCRHSQSSSKPIAMSSAAKPDSLRSPVARTRSTPTSALSPSHQLFRNSPISFLARTFGGGGTGDISSSAMEDDRPQRIVGPSQHSKAPDALDSSATVRATADGGGIQAFFSTSPSFTGHLPTPPQRLHSRASSCSCSCSCSCAGSSWTASDSYASSSMPSLDVTVCPMTAPGPDGAYHPHVPLPSLLRCYGDSETRNLFHGAPSTSSDGTESRSATPFSSEWSAGASSTNADLTLPAAAAAADAPSDDPLVSPAEAQLTEADTVNANQHPSPDEGMRQRRASPRSPHHHRHLGNSVASPNTQTQLSILTEMDAIDKGRVAPYVSYLFAPEARVVDLRHVEGQMLPQREPSSSPVAATCVHFYHAGDAYLVGTSSGFLWRVPAGGGQEAVRATPLGSLWPPHAPAGVNAATDGVGVGARSATHAFSASNTATATGGASNAVPNGLGGVLPDGAAAAASALSSQPVPLSGHTAAILSIAFNDDGTLYATTGLDGCVIVWKASTCAKLRRISAVWANASAVQRAPHLVRFMPQNNNYLLVSYVDSSELHLYNSSTGLPVTNVAGTGLTQLTASGSVSSGGGTMRSKNLLKSGSKPSKGNGGGGAITALAVDLIASPFFLSGDGDGTVALWTYRAGDLVIWPTLRATSTSSTSGGSGGAARHSHSRSYVTDPLNPHSNSGRDDGSSAGSGAIFVTPLYQLPELRRVAACVLPAHAGGVAAISVSVLYAAQLHSLFRPCGSPSKAARVAAAAEANDERAGEATARAGGRLHQPPEATAQVLHAAAVQNRACRAELDARKAEVEEAAATAGNAAAIRSRRDTHTRSLSMLKHGGGDSATATRTNSGGVSSSGTTSSSFPHVLAGLPSRLSDTFSALWGGGGGNNGSHGGAPSSSATTTAARRADSSLALPKSSTASAGASSFDPAAMTEKELLKQLRGDALDVVCPLLILVTAPCDTVYALGLLLQLQRGTPPHSNSSNAGGGHHHSSVAKPTVSYRLYPLLKTTGPSRMRHVGVGAVASPDNRRLVVVAAPCEEGFVRVLPLLRIEAAAEAAAPTTPTPTTKADATAPGPGSGTTRNGGSEATRMNKKHVLATLPMPYGGRCTGIAWSPTGRFLVAITAEGVIYEWSRVYLNTDTPSSSSAAADRALRKAAAGPLQQGTELGKGKSGGAAGHASTALGEDADAANALTITAKNARRPLAGVDAVDAPASAAAKRWRGCDTEFSDTVHRPVSAHDFTSLLGTSMAAPAAAAAAAVVAVAGESDAARAAFIEEDAWRESFQRELERQRREQAALKLVTRPDNGDENEVSSSGYWLEKDPNSEASCDTFDEDEETEQDDATSPH
ncbi:hypothetical protein ABB37_00121 [Leptomonas pyrrhocoris]|uniref:Uncharacterized protein n=1 Tax=Leptomonas pyrrhocoris TaxID=157538 RepID=A0A0M9GA42_LEPPY|nr:hypothetical protein ABB37_00121 [Leptomonas pyrrhocoris]KPA85766.1 hypothetical protein ABB37_00121 [Leptomonas pyrrhocoris]|eukprot:XP_015664205.1 hypothetical protein ABB37_00121 [Leptomonas pyrrhocoris]